jgi:tetratricopeptide (TPR) repeat protein
MRPNAPNERQRVHAEALQRAQVAIQNERPAEAERIAGEILKANAGHAEATKLFGYALLMQARPEEAVAPLEKAARASHDPEIETQLAIALRQAGLIDKALIWLKRAIKRTPPFAAAFHELGYVLHALNRSVEAIEVLQQGIAVAPMMTEMPIQLGFVYYAINDRANAGSAFARAVYKPRPSRSDSRIDRGADGRGRLCAGRRTVPARHRGKSRRHAGAHRPRQLSA